MWQIRYGLGGGFGGCERNEWEDTDAKTEEEASRFAWESACEEYDQYDGCHGLRDLETIMEEDDLSEEGAQEEWEEEREGWLDYEVREV